MQTPNRLAGTLTITMPDEIQESEVIFAGEGIFVDSPLTGGWLRLDEPTTITDPRDLPGLSGRMPSRCGWWA